MQIKTDKSLAWTFGNFTCPLDLPPPDSLSLEALEHRASKIASFLLLEAQRWKSPELRVLVSPLMESISPSDVHSGAAAINFTSVRQLIRFAEMIEERFAAYLAWRTAQVSFTDALVVRTASDDRELRLYCFDVVDDGLAMTAWSERADPPDSEGWADVEAYYLTRDFSSVLPKEYPVEQVGPWIEVGRERKVHPICFDAEARAGGEPCSVRNMLWAHCTGDFACMVITWETGQSAAAALEGLRALDIERLPAATLDHRLSPGLTKAETFDMMVKHFVPGPFGEVWSVDSFVKFIDPSRLVWEAVITARLQELRSRFVAEELDSKGLAFELRLENLCTGLTIPRKQSFNISDGAVLF